MFQRADGCWVASIQVGVKANGKADIRTRYAKTEAEAKRKLKATVAMADHCRHNSISDGAVGMRSLIDWIISADITGDGRG